MQRPRTTPPPDALEAHPGDAPTPPAVAAFAAAAAAAAGAGRREDGRAAAVAAGGGAGPKGKEEAPWLKDYWIYVKPVELYNVLRLRAKHRVSESGGMAGSERGRDGLAKMRTPN